MGYAVATVLLLLCIFDYTWQKTWTAPGVIFCGFWAIISFLASLRLFNINAVGIKTWLVILIGNLSFLLGTKIIIRAGKKRSPSIQGTQLKGDGNRVCYYLPQKVYWILFIIVGIYMAGQLVQTMRLISTGVTLADIRRASFGMSEIAGYNYSKGFFAGFFRTLISAIKTILIVAGIDSYFRNTQKNIIYIIAAAFLTFCDAFSNGGRWIFLYFIVEFFCCRSILFDQTSTPRASIFSGKKFKRAIFAVIVFVVILFAFSQISIDRGIEKDNMGKTLYIYFCGCVPFLDVKIKEIDGARIYSYFFAGQYGFWSYMIPVLKRITGYKFPIFSQIIIKVMNAQDARYIGGGVFNAFVTAFYYLYADLRFFGVVIGMFVFGIIAGTLFKKARLDQSSSVLVPYLFISQIIVKSIQSYAFSSADYVFIFVIMIIISVLSKYKIRLK